jgi:hypothetical protein
VLQFDDVMNQQRETDLPSAPRGAGGDSISSHIDGLRESLIADALERLAVNARTIPPGMSGVAEYLERICLKPATSRLHSVRSSAATATIPAGADRAQRRFLPRTGEDDLRNRHRHARV